MKGTIYGNNVSIGFINDLTKATGISREEFMALRRYDDATKYLFDSSQPIAEKIVKVPGIKDIQASVNIPTGAIKKTVRFKTKTIYKRDADGNILKKISATTNKEVKVVDHKEYELDDNGKPIVIATISIDEKYRSAITKGKDILAGRYYNVFGMKMAGNDYYLYCVDKLMRDIVLSIRKDTSLASKCGIALEYLEYSDLFPEIQASVEARERQAVLREYKARAKEEMLAATSVPALPSSCTSAASIIKVEVERARRV